jgi:RNA polymerase sigma-70 factor (ECF subfamily)
MVYQLAFHLLADHNDALDLSQDVFLQVFRMLPRFRGQSTLKTWIIRIVVNQARNRQRWWQRRFRSAQVCRPARRAARRPAGDHHLERAGSVLGRRELAARLTTALLDCPSTSARRWSCEMDGLSYGKSRSRRASRSGR